MKVLTFEKLPPLDENLGDLEVVTSGDHCIVRTEEFLALCSLNTGAVEWCVDRSAPQYCGSREPLADAVFDFYGAKLWIGLQADVVAEIFYEDPDSIRLVARCMQTGNVLWEYVHNRPALAQWAEEKPAWPGAAQEEIYVFLARSHNSLVLCLHRNTRRSGMSTPEFTVFETPPFQCQTDLYSFEPTTGAIRWSRTQIGLRLNILEWSDFRGSWANQKQAGWLDLESGSANTLERPGYCFGMSRIYGEFGYFPWFDKKSKRIGYIRTNQRMEVDCEYSWNEKSVRDIRIWPSSLGVAIQVNDQKIIWTTAGDRIWEQKAKPYVYRVLATDQSDIFVATDGNGGRLLGFDRTDGHETFNFRPVLGGLGHTHFFEKAQLAVASVSVKKSHRVPSKLLVFKTDTKDMQFGSDCWMILSDWSRGIVFVTGEKERKIALLDLGV